MWEPLGWLAPAASLPSPHPCVVSSQAPGPTWGPEVPWPHTSFVGFCEQRGTGGAVVGRRGQKVRSGAHACP